MTDIKKVNKFLETQTHMVVAVVLRDGTPWAVPVRIINHKSLEFEWESKLNTLHSLALVQQPDMAITLFQKNDKTEFGFYAKGTGELVEQKGEYGHYKFTVKESWVNDETFVKRRVEL